MALYFADRLHIYGGSGQYTLQGFDGTDWLSLHTIYGTSEGDIEIDAITNPIPVDPSIPTNTPIPFRWIDSNGMVSNVVTVSIPVEHDYTLTTYAFGTTEIGFVNNGGDNWTVNFPFSFDTLVATGTLVGMTVTSVFYQGGAPNGSLGFRGVYTTSAYPHTYSGNGAGIYFNYVVYQFTDGMYIVLIHLVQVDNAGGLVRSLSMKGFDPVSISGAHVSLTANYEITGTDPVTPTHLNFSAAGVGGSGTTFSATLPGNTVDLVFDFGLTTSEWTDLLVGPNPNINGAIIDSGVNLT